MGGRRRIGELQWAEFGRWTWSRLQVRHDIEVEIQGRISKKLGYRTFMIISKFSQSKTSSSARIATNIAVH
jgi:hypothetical protein